MKNKKSPAERACTDSFCRGRISFLHDIRGTTPLRVLKKLCIKKSLTIRELLSQRPSLHRFSLQIEKKSSLQGFPDERALFKEFQQIPGN
jgi:hypothetical protein